MKKDNDGTLIAEREAWVDMRSSTTALTIVVDYIFLSLTLKDLVDGCKKLVETSLFIVAFGLGGYLGGMTAGGSHHGAQASLTGDTGNAHTDSNHHQDKAIDISAWAKVPELKLVLHQDPVSGWNLQIITKNFQFAPERAGSKHIVGEGHAHLFVDGKKTARVYGSWVHLSNLDPGIHEIEVSLNANSHESLVMNGEVVSERLKIRVDE